MRTLLAALFALSLAVSTTAQQLTYTVDLRHTASKEVSVDVLIKGVKGKSVSYQMPVWAPGAYSVTNYGRFVKDFRAYDAFGKQIDAKKVDENRWEMPKNAKLARITYSVINSYLDSTSLYFAMCHIDTNFFFANGTALFGYVDDQKGVRSHVSYQLPEGWTAYTASNEATITAPLTFDAKDYDELADAPVMAGKDLQFREFEQEGAKYDIALASDLPFPMDSLAEYTKKIVKAQTDFFHDTPFKRYTFLINAPTFSHSPSQAFGALEHANSSAYLMINMSWSFFKEYGLSTISHEFFHLWNVKRIHSNKLGPFDYTKRVMTTSLWLSEGVTDYYGNNLLSRSGIMPPDYFEKKITEWGSAARMSRAAGSETLEQLSIDESDFDLGKAMSFYTKGPLVALMLDLEIRSKTENRKSLDDVMRSLYAEAKQGNHFSDEELIHRVEKFSSVDLTDFYHKYIAGTDSLPLGAYLPMMGLLKDQEYTTSSGVSWRTRFVHDDSALVIESFYDSSELADAGLAVGDTILTVNGEHMTRDDADEFSLNNDAPRKVDLVVSHAGLKSKHSVMLAHPRSTRTAKHDIAPDPNATPQAKAIRKQIYGG